MHTALARDPREWQIEALKRWRDNKRRGIVRVVTGGGKTLFALQCALDAMAEYPGLRVAIVVPSVALLDQWYVDLQEELGATPDEIHVVHSGATPNPGARFYLAVINTARTRGVGLPSNMPGMLVVDECHRAGADQSREALNGSFVATLGLSATPEREYDEALTDVLIPRLGKIIFEYSYVEAASDRVITPFSLVNIEAPLTGEEHDQYEKLTRQVSIAWRAFKEGRVDETRVKILLRRRALLSAKARRRVPVAVSLADAHRGARIVIFHEGIAEAEEIARLLRERNHNVTLYHSKIASAMRRDNLRLFRRGQFQILVSCRALDEGVNVPETEIGIIASSTASTRQRIQRLGRVLRPAPGKDSATVYTLFATKVEEERLRAEAEGLVGTADVVWRRARVG
jgi:superfamily II DNA or RNA helicase